VLGGRTATAARRAGRLADGFFPHQRDLSQLAPLFDEARGAAEAAGRPADSLQLIAGGARTPADLDLLADLGVTHVVHSPRATGPEDLFRALESYRTQVIRPVLGV